MLQHLGQLSNSAREIDAFFVQQFVTSELDMKVMLPFIQHFIECYGIGSQLLYVLQDLDQLPDLAIEIAAFRTTICRRRAGYKDNAVFHTTFY